MTPIPGADTEVRACSGVHTGCKSHDLAASMHTEDCRLPTSDTYQYLSVSCLFAAGMHGIREDWTVDLLACTYHAGKFAIWGAVEGIIIAICVLGICEAAAPTCNRRPHNCCSSVCLHIKHCSCHLLREHYCMS